MHIMESIEEHPYIAAGGVFVLGIVLIIILFSGGSKAQAAVATPQSDTSAATQYAMAQLQSQTALGVAQINAGRDANANAATVQALQIQAATTQNHDLQQYNTTIGAALVNRDTAIGTSTIQANYMSHASDNALTASLADTAAQKAVQLSAVDAQRSIGLASVDASKTVNLASIAGSVQVAGLQAATAQKLSGDQLAAALAGYASATAISSNSLAAIRNTNATQQAITHDNNQVALIENGTRSFLGWNAGQLHLDDNRTALESQRIQLSQFNH